MGANLIGLLQSWVGSEVTVVTPESYKSTQLGKGLTFQTYQAKLDQIGDDFLKLTFTAKKQETTTDVEQIIPLNRVKRISSWGDEKLIHL